ncbi:hypothetical protein D7Y11_42265, partial [Corallococcus sp. AB018]
MEAGAFTGFLVPPVPCIIVSVRPEGAVSVATRANGQSPNAEVILDEVRSDVPQSADAFWLKREMLA